MFVENIYSPRKDLLNNFPIKPNGKATIAFLTAKMSEKYNIFFGSSRNKFHSVISNYSLN